MGLQEELLALKANIEKQVPEETLQVMQSATERLKNSAIMETCLKGGDKAPAFSLPNSESKTISSKGLLAQGPLVVNFYRGGW